mgnify:CR=1 FL=1
MHQTKVIKISEIEKLIQAGYEVEVESPDGFVPVTDFVDKGMWEEYILSFEDPDLTPVRCNENHLFETTVGWVSAKELLGKDLVNFITKHGLKQGSVNRTYEKIPIVDIQVDHENHRYYTEDVSSHNTGVGKSLAMCHFAAAAVAAGQNVLYITMEMSEERIAERIDANLLDIPIDQIDKLPKDMFKSKIATLKRKTQGELMIKEYPTGAASAAHFRSLLNEYKLKKNFVPDIIFVDYLNICASSRLKMGGSMNSYTYIKSIAEELRGLAQEFNLPLVSATQTTRSGFGNSDIGLEDTSESFGLPATADLMFALTTNDELEAMGQIAIKQLKNRYNDLNQHKRFVLGVDKSKMRLYDVDDGEQNLVQDIPMFDRGEIGDRDKFSGFKME